jgi:mono/diheme cytochrome c family protein
MNTLRILLSIAFTVVMLKTTLAEAADTRAIERGRYLVKIAGCNDCHTPDYAATGGNVPEKTWLIGDHLGWRGDWGTTYPRNLRIYMSAITEDRWVKVARTAQFRPPMPWFALRDMSETDLRAIHRFVRSLGPAGAQVPSYVPPDRDPIGPVINFPRSAQ